jgi:soluble lytic murein transglycosylase-like protein
MRSRVSLRFLWALALILSTTSRALAQAPTRQTDPFNDWAAQFSERLERDLAALNAESARQPEAFVRADQAHSKASNKPAAAVPTRSETALGAFRSAVESLLAEEGLPVQFSGIAAVESGYRPRAVSRKGAAGIWQLMPETARRYGLIVAGERDERLDPQKSTVAAARYLKDLYAQFEDWPLAFAAYNAGEDRIARLLGRFSAHDFWTLSRLAALPEETRSYVPAVLRAIGESRCGSLGGSFSAVVCAFVAEPALRLPIGAGAGARPIYASPSPSPEPMASGGSGGS